MSARLIEILPRSTIDYLPRYVTLSAFLVLLVESATNSLEAHSACP